MSDRNKMALLCILLVLAFAIWVKPDFSTEKDFNADDLFQEARTEDNTVIFQTTVSNTKIQALKETSKITESGESPFA